MWDTLIINPMINALLLFYDALGNQFILAITVFTVLIRLILLPLSVRSQRTTVRTQQMQPQIQAIQKKYKDNPKRMQEEFQKIGYNPAESLGGCLPLLLQFPILIGLYQAILITLGSTPQALFELTQRAYPVIDLSQLLPIANKFLWMNLGQPDPLFVLPILVFVSMFAQSKLLAPPKPPEQKGKKGQEQDNPAAAMSQSMQYTMPIMFGFFSLQFPAGLSIYFVLANLIGIGQGYYTRWLMSRDEESESDSSGTMAGGSANGEEPDVVPAEGQPQIQEPARTRVKKTSKRKRRSKKK